MTDTSRAVTPKLFIGKPGMVDSTEAFGPYTALEIIQRGATAWVADAAMAIEVMVLLGHDRPYAEWCTNPTGPISFGESEATGG